MEAIAIPLLLVIGGMLAVQAAANVQLASATGNPLAAASLQLSIGAVLLVALAAVIGTLGAVHQLAGVSPWHLVGGLASALYITAGILLFPRLGAVVTVGMFITGQMLGSLTLDGGALLGIHARHITIVMLVGLLAVLAGAAIIVRSQSGPSAPDSGGSQRARWLLLALVAGAALPFQGAINAQLRTDIGAPITVGAVSFVVATLAMTLVLIASQALRSSPRVNLASLSQVPWWGWLGGLIGGAYVTSVFLIIPVIGASSTVALTVAGQQVASLIVDRFGLLRLPKRPIARTRLMGVATLITGVALIQLL